MLCAARSSWEGRAQTVDGVGGFRAAFSGLTRKLFRACQVHRFISNRTAVFLPKEVTNLNLRDLLPVSRHRIGLSAPCHPPFRPGLKRWQARVKMARQVE